MMCINVLRMTTRALLEEIVGERSTVEGDDLGGAF
jgi:hypothetical protein